MATGFVLLFEQGHFFVLLLALPIALIAINIVLVRQFLAPLERTILRTQSLVDPLAQEELAERENRFHDEVGEWQDLEAVIERVRKERRLQDLKFSKEHAEFEALMGALSEPVVAISKDKTVRFFNSQFALLFGLRQDRNKSFILGDFVRAPDMLEAFEKVLKSGESVNVPLTLYLGNESKPTHFALSISALREQGKGGVEGAVGILFDVSDLRKAEEVRIEFVGNVSHELRTPLTAIQGYADVLKQDLDSYSKQNEVPLPKHVEKYLEVMSKNVIRLRELVDDLLDLSSLESGGDLKIENVETRIATERAIEQVEAKRAVKNQEIVGFFEVEHIRADANRVEQVLINLIDNAIKYIPNGGRIDVRWEHSPKGGTLLRVKDNGPGIPKKHRDRLFERFYRIDEARSRDTGGSGLGLAIVKHIMQSHGGSVEVTSTEGVGTEFLCSFP